MAPDSKMETGFPPPSGAWSTNAGIRLLGEIARNSGVNWSPAPPLNPAPPAGCRPEITAGPGVEAFYPDLSRKLGEEGPVTVYFRLDQAEGQAMQIQVGQSSLSAELDQAAMLYIANQTFKVACPGNQFRLRVRFKLQEPVPAP